MNEVERWTTAATHAHTPRAATLAAPLAHARRGAAPSILRIVRACVGATMQVKASEL